jgi:microcystin-dependent protein
MMSKESKTLSRTVVVGLIAVMAWASPGVCASDPFLGEIMIVPYDFAPLDWAFCDGQLLSVFQNQALFALLGDTYGGDGRNTFALPDLRGRVPIHEGMGPGLSNRSLGERGGTERETLTILQMPQHSHVADALGHSGEGDATGPGNAVWAATPKKKDTDYSSQVPDVAMSADAVFIDDNGGGQAHNNMPPYLTLNYVIALKGVFPLRN